MSPSKPFRFIAGACVLFAISGCGGGLNPNPGGNNPITLSGRLNSSDFYDEDSDRYYDIYVADAVDTDTARVAMRSTDFDTQFYVYEKDGDGAYVLIDSNDDANSGTTDSDDTFPVVYGRTYRILATSSRPNERGFYEIRFSRELGRPAQVTSQEVALAKSALKLPARAKK